ncbi:MAG: AAA family ATPase [Candidatus Eremiobacteraeota bacterium]|nr:AAA family ATPase [Candidatus Eremiobacteraeota bacterium]
MIVAHALDECLAIGGGPGSGKTTALVERADRLAADSPPGATLLLAPSDAGVARLRARATANVACTSFGDLAFALLHDARAVDGCPDDVEEIDDVRASQHFERAGAALFALEWTEFADELDPEITGLRAPERFSAAAFRLIRKLRASLISPEDFKALGLRGATTFYARPPNLASADLIMETGAKYRDSLRVGPGELERQRLREVDLVKILARLYASYLETLVRNGCMTPTDAVYEAATLLRARPDLRERASARYAAALVDDAVDVTPGQLALLEAIFGEHLRHVTFAGDAAQATRGFATGALGPGILKRAATTIVLDERRRGDPEIERAARRVLDPRDATAGPLAAEDGAVTLYRAETVRDEARFVTAEIEALVRAGTPPCEIAIVSRGLGCAQTYVNALLARNVPVDVAGAGSLYEYPVVLDALAALWSAVDPFRHDFLLRSLEAPWLRLGDASIATLCADASDPQPLLFELPDDVPETGDRRWDRRRDLRLGRNVTRGDVDADLPDETRERLAAFRTVRARWEDAARTLDLAQHARAILDESVLATLASGARGRFDAGLVARLIDEIDSFARRDPLATLEDFLAHAESVAVAEADLLSIAPRDVTAVRVLDVEASKGEEFDAVFVVDVRAGGWPRYYVPDAFLFMPSAGMIPKENVGDADAARTAKFTYALFCYKIREKYVAEERRALYCAMTRARRKLFVSAAGRATKGNAAPEILEELQRARR